MSNHELKKHLISVGIGGVVLATTGNRILAIAAVKFVRNACDHFSGQAANDNPPIIDAYQPDGPEGRRNA